MKLAISLLVLLLVASGSAFAAELEIHYINVGWGSSVLVKGPNGTTLLLEAGNTGKGTSEVVPYLQSIGIPPSSGITATIVGHQHCDHLGGLDEVVAAGYNVSVRNWYNGSSNTSSCVTQWNAAAAGTTAGAPVAMPVGTVILLGDGATATCVARNGEIIGGMQRGVTDENDRSIALLIQYRGFDFLWASDLGGGDDDEACTGRSTSQVDVESFVIDAISPGGDSPLITTDGIDVLGVNHHGSESSTNANYMNGSRPEFAIIATGAGQSSNFQLPRKAVVENVLLSQAACITAPPTIVLQTEEGDPIGPDTSLAGLSVGDIKIRTDGVLYEVSANGAVNQGPNEVGIAGLPKTQATDDFTKFLAPLSMVATATSTTTVSVSWMPSDGAHHYEVWRTPNNAAFFLAGSPTGSPFTDTGRTEGTTYLYKVRAVSSMGGFSDFSNVDLATPVVFSDNPLQGGVTSVRLTHVNELRAAVNAFRASARIAPFSFTDNPLEGGIVKAVHVTELRTAIDQGRAAFGVPAIGYTYTIEPGTLIHALDIMELRSAVK